MEEWGVQVEGDCGQSINVALHCFCCSCFSHSAVWGSTGHSHFRRYTHATVCGHPQAAEWRSANHGLSTGCRGIASPSPGGSISSLSPPFPFLLVNTLLLFLLSPPPSVVLSSLSSIYFPQGTPTWVAGRSSALQWVGWSWKLSVGNCWKKRVPWRDHVGEGEKHERKQYWRWPIVDCPQSSAPPPSALLGVEGSGRVINETVKLNQGKGVLKEEWCRLFILLYNSILIDNKIDQFSQTESCFDPCWYLISDVLSLSEVIIYILHPIFSYLCPAEEGK